MKFSINVEIVLFLRMRILLTQGCKQVEVNYPSYLFNLRLKDLVSSPPTPTLTLTPSPTLTPLPVLGEFTTYWRMTSRHSLNDDFASVDKIRLTSCRLYLPACRLD